MIKRNFLWRVYTVIKFSGDMILAIALFFIAYYIRFYDKIFISIFPPIKGIPDISLYYNFVPFFILVVLISHFYCGYYKKELLTAIDEFILVSKSTMIIGILMFAVGFFYRGTEYSRLFMLLIVVLNTIAIFIWHQILKYVYVKYTKYFFGKPRIGLIGESEKIKRIKETVVEDKNIKLFFLPYIKVKNELNDFILKKNLSELIIDYKLFDSELFQDILPWLNQQSIETKILLDIPIKLTETSIDASLGIPVITIKPVPISGVNYFIKRTMDILISILVLSILFIPFIFIALLIKFDSEGPVFFINKRIGYKGKPFGCIKFRTMVKDAHSMWWKLLKQSERGDKVFKLRNDPRITSIGKILRRLSIDELPQFFNILKGEMSIVGPRPQIVEEVSFYDEYAKRRLMIIPGLTGLWQISGRADIGFEEMVDLDLYYLENWSLGLDIKIIFKTFFAIFSKTGAY